MTTYLDLADFLVIAAAVLQIDAESLYLQANLPLAESALSAPMAGFGEVEFYPSIEVKIAVLGHRIVANHALPDGNKRTSLICMQEMAVLNAKRWVPPAADDSDADETVATMVALAAGTMSFDHFAAWVSERIRPA